MRKVDELKPREKKVVVRVDWNIALGKTLRVVDDTRIRKTLPTLKYLLGAGVKRVVLLAHLGRPEGRVVPELSLAPVTKYASDLLGEKIELEETIESANESGARLAMLENLRFWKGEKADKVEFAEKLAGLGEAYVNEAFGVSHRKVASVTGVAKLLPAYAGFNLVEEVERISGAMESPKRPLVVIVGGAKVEDKLGVLERLSRKAETLLLGGRLANEFMTGKIKLSGRARILTPVDGEGEPYLDIGRKTRKIFAEEIKTAGTVIWNGPMGKVEKEQYRAGTHAIYEALMENEPAEVIVGGGDTLAAIKNEKHLERIDWISTGGGAMLKLIEKGTLPGIEVLQS